MTALMLEKPIVATKEAPRYEAPKSLELVSFIGELREVSADERMGMLEVMNSGTPCTHGCSAPSNCACK